MKRILIILLSMMLVLSMAGCKRNQSQEIPAGYSEFSTDIYLCDDVYRTDDTPTYGKGVIGLDLSQGGLEVKDYQLLLCRDNCDRTSIVSRASQGYAPVYQVVEAGQLKGNYRTLKFQMVVPEEMDGGAPAPEGNYYYLLSLDKTLNIYIHLAQIPGEIAPETAESLADSIISSAIINMEPKQKQNRPMKP